MLFLQDQVTFIESTLNTMHISAVNTRKGKQQRIHVLRLIMIETVLRDAARLPHPPGG